MIQQSMSTPLENLQSTLDAVQQELQRVRQRLDELEKIVSIESDAEGVRRVCLECQELVIRPAHDPQGVALRLGSDESGGFLHLHEGHELAICAELSLDASGGPQMLLRGKDHQPRISLFTQEDCGFVAVHAAEGRPGALMRAQPLGGSVAVLQKDGGTRGVLVHHDGEITEDGTVKPPSTDLLFADGSLNSMIKLHTDGEGGLLSLGPPGQPDSIALVARDDGPALMLHSPAELQSISMMALDGAAQICVHEGKVPGSGFEAHISSGESGSSFSLRGERGEKSVDISALDVASSLTLHDMNGEARVMLAHHYESHSALTLQATGEEDGFRAIASEEVSSMELMSPHDPDTKLLSAVTTNKPVVILQKQRRPMLMFGEGDQGGVFCAYGNAAGQAGIATLSGGPVAGSILLSTADGTPQLTLDATDHGGRLLINNDLGFQRVSLGIYQEAGSLQLNNTGNLGVQAIATAKGGVVMVNDADGETSATLPEDFDTGKDTGWGRLPDNF